MGQLRLSLKLALNDVKCYVLEKDRHRAKDRESEIEREERKGGELKFPFFCVMGME